MLNSARKGLSYAAMLVMLAATVAVADNAPAGGTNDGNDAGWQKGQPKGVQLGARIVKLKAVSTNRLV
jgi:hypothetical protein